MAEFLADEDVPTRLNAALRLLGHEVTTVRQIDSSKSGSGISDRDVLLYAIERSWIVVTCNERHFRRLNREIPWHSGIITVGHENDSQRLSKLARHIDAEFKAAAKIRGRFFRMELPPKDQAKARLKCRRKR